MQASSQPIAQSNQRNGVVTLHTSNRTELLAAKLARILERPSGGPFEAETILVQGRGMATWLSMQLAQHHGVCAHVDFTYPRALVWTAFRELLGEQAIDEAELNEERLFWLILKELPGHLQSAEFSRVSRYLSHDPRGTKLFELAAKLATAFDQYLIYRPELIQMWESGVNDGAPPAQHWQPILWRQLRKAVTGHIAALETTFHRRMQEVASDAVELARIPKRVTLFGVTTLPPLFLRVLAALAQVTELHVFVFQPAERHNAQLLDSLHAQGEDFRSLLEQSIIDADVGLQIEAELIPPEELSMLGVLQRSLFGPVGSLSSSPHDEHSSASQPLVTRPPTKRKGTGRRGRKRPGPGERGEQLSLLGLMSDTAPAPPEAPPIPGADEYPEDFEYPEEPARAAYTPQPINRRVFNPTERSLQVHSCHSPMREVEVLHDVILDLLDSSESQLEPHQIIVMTPDVEAYAPLIEAVFDRTRGSAQFIPYRISDRSARADSPILDAFQRVLAMAGGRASSTEVLDLLSLTPIQKRFEITTDDLELITRWVVESGIRWGVDENHRQREHQPLTDQNTWRQGLDRLLLGYAMPTEEQQTFAGLLPYEEVEGNNAELLGRFAQFTDRLFSALEELNNNYTIEIWQEKLEHILADLLHFDFETALQHQRIQSSLSDLVAEAKADAYTGELPLPVVVRLLERKVDGHTQERGFLSNGVTFCAMVPMRTIPFKTVCLLGMNDGAFPRTESVVDFDLIRHGTVKTKLGDRDRRKDDRQLFLEALMAAREHLVITYTGQSIRDNAERPPSVVVSELLDAVAQHYDPSSTDASSLSESKRTEELTEQVVLRHPLQGFSPRYFNGEHPRLFSFSEAYQLAATHLGPERHKPPAFFAAALGTEPDAERNVSLQELRRFWSDPIKELLSARLQLNLRDNAIDVPDREPVELEPLEAYAVGNAMLQHELTGLTKQHSLELLTASGHLPLGNAASFTQEELEETVRLIASAVREEQLGQQEPSVVVDQALGAGWRLSGQVGERWTQTQVSYQFSKLQAKQLLVHWIQHLLMCASEQGQRTVVIGRHPKPNKLRRKVTFLPVPNAADPLKQLLEVRQLGLEAPLRFAPRTSLKFVEKLRERQGKADADAQALLAAQKEYTVNLGELALGPHLRRVFAEQLPPFEHVLTSAPGFEELAQQVFEPMLDAMEDD